ncbi:MAG: hypothetical protein M3310_02600 [Actinomycetota bacterium]|nr:hypothetical protein [Actinomycetota bacterium]
MTRRWVEIAFVAAAALVAAMWTHNAAIAALPWIYYAVDRAGWRRLRRSAS